MSFQKLKPFLFVLAALAPVGYAIETAVTADHRDSASVRAESGDRNVDINDLYAWTTSGGNLVLAMTIVPVATSSDYLNPDYLYQFKIDDDDADLDEDQVIQVRVRGTGSSQTYQVFGPGTPAVIGADGNEIIDVEPLEGTFNNVADNGTMKAFVGLRDDPFFFDLNRYVAILDTVRSAGAANIGFNNPGSDFFAGLNTIAIALELPKSMISSGSGAVNIWATSSHEN
jgi:hypothetical protein